MTEQSKQNKAGKPGYYFKIIPKEEFPKFLDRLKEALEKIENKKGDKKIIDFEIRGTKEDLDGLSLEIFTFDESKYDDFIDIEQEHIKNALYFFSLNFNVKTEVDVEKLKNVYEQFKPMIEAMPIFKDKLKFCFRNKGTKVSFDFVGKEGKLFSDLMSLGIDPAEYRKFYFALILGVNLTEIFDPTADQAEIFVKIFSVIFSIKSETDNVKYLIKALVEALKDVKLSDKNIQKKFDKFVRYLSFIYSFIGVKLNIEYDAKVLAGEIAKKAEKQTGGLEGLKAKISQTKQMAMGMGQQMIIPYLMAFGMIDTVKAINLDCISISLGIPKYKTGYAISFKLPGLSKVFGDMVANIFP